jgi:hypothetical protein
MSYIAAILVVLFVYFFVLALVQKLADLAIILVVIGAMGFICYGIYAGAVTTWPEVLLASLGLGAASAVVSVPLIPFSSRFRERWEARAKKKEEV